MQSAAAALNDFLGESSDAASDDEEGRNRRSVTKAIKPGALSSALSRGKMNMFSCPYYHLLV